MLLNLLLILRMWEARRSLKLRFRKRTRTLYLTLEIKELDEKCTKLEKEINEQQLKIMISGRHIYPRMSQVWRGCHLTSLMKMTIS
jgi:hypothetical protein